MGVGGKGSEEDKIDCAGDVDDVQGGGPDSATLWEQGLGSDGSDAEGAGGVASLGSLEDSRDFSSASHGGGMEC